MQVSKPNRKTKWALKLTKDATLNHGTVEGYILEDGSIIAKFKRTRWVGYVAPFEIKQVFSERAIARFDNYCNFLSKDETIALMYKNQTGRF